VTLSSICGSDPHYHRHGDEMGIPRGGRSGHECAGAVEVVGSPLPVDWVDQFLRNVTVTGGVVPWPVSLEQLLERVADGSADPSPMFTHTLPLDDAAEGDRPMSERATGVVKVALRPAP
jgi:threonine dehydrogenase-like Zn-dependent dehydrogenase